jgi:hypothetical protein
MTPTSRAKGRRSQLSLRRIASSKLFFGLCTAVVEHPQFPMDCYDSSPAPIGHYARDAFRYRSEVLNAAGCSDNVPDADASS